MVLSKIGSSLGQALYADDCTINISRISFARILVEMDVTKVLPKLVKIQDPETKIFEQAIVYEWKPIFCQKCLQVGYSYQEKLVIVPGVRKG